jgi:hypothetical protein
VQQRAVEFSIHAACTDGSMEAGETAICSSNAKAIIMHQYCDTYAESQNSRTTENISC